MSDAIEARLRRMNDELLMVGNDYSDVLLDAATEIEALRAQVTALIQERDSLSRRGDFWMQNATEMDAKLADCQALIRERGHAEHCPTRQCCKVCGTPKMWTAHRSIFDDYPEYHEFQPGPCSDACGHDRTTGEKA